MFELTANQRSIWFDQVLHGQSGLYNVGGYIAINGALDPALFQQAVDLLIAANDALRLRFHESDGEPQQEIPGPFPYPIDLLDFSAETEPETACLSWMNEQASVPFFLEDHPLFCFRLLKVSSDKYFWYIRLHHLISDGWSISLIVKQVAEIYTALASGTKPESNTFSFSDHIREDQEYRKSGTYETDEGYWKEQFSQLPEPLEPGNRQRLKDSFRPESKRYSFFIDRSDYNALAEIAKNAGASIAHAFLGILFTQFQYSRGVNDVVIGLPILNRSSRQFKQTVGLFAGMTPFRMRFDDVADFSDLLRRIKLASREHFRHQKFPISAIQQFTHSQAPLFDVALSFEKHDYQVDFNEIPTDQEALPHNREKLPIAVYVREYEDDKAVKIDIDFNTTYWDEAYMDQFVRHFHYLAQTIATKGELSPGSCLLPEQDIATQLNWNRPAIVSEETITGVFSETVQQFANQFALITDSESLTYRELDEQSNQLAHLLVEQYGVQSGQMVGLLTERSAQTVIGLLAILKAGGIYLPIDPTYPEERIRYMLTESECRLLLTSGSADLSWYSGQKIDIKGIDQSLPLTYPLVTVKASNTAYVIFTSGSTGKPKGVPVRHGSFVNMAREQVSVFGVCPEDRCLQFASFSFDASVSEIFMALFAGASLVLTPEAARADQEGFGKFVNKQGITILTLPPSYLSALPETALAPVKTIITAGEAAIFRDAERWSKTKNYFNAYGPTENAVCTTIYRFASEYEGPNVPIGKPIANVTTYVLNEQLNLLPIGSTGELYIGGTGLTEGYLNRPDLTAERFVDSPFDKGEKLYKTGDLVRLLPDGNIEFAGRTDEQVKLRGFRIELGEIEQALLAHPSVRLAAVVVDHATQSLVACLESLASDTIEQTELRDHLSALLPAYMIPERFIVLEILPLTSNGKIDKKALALQDFPTPNAAQLPLAPRTPLERLIHQAWEEVFGTAVASVHDHFFELGGHSLKATQVVSRIHLQTGVRMELSEFFQQPTIAGQATLISGKSQTKTITVSALPKADLYHLSSSQRRMWIAEQLSMTSAYNMPVIMALNGEIDQRNLRNAFKAVVHRHESLRTQFVSKKGQPFQQVIEDPDVTLEVTDLSLTNEPRDGLRALMATHVEHRFDLERAPLFKTSLVKLGGQRHLLLLTLHHIVGDGWSLKLIMDDLTRAYAGEQLQAEIIQYKDSAAFFETIAQSEEGKEQLNYWRQKLGGDLPVLDLPTDFERPAERSFNGAVHRFSIAKNQAEQLRELGRETGTSTFMLLQTAVKILLYKLTGQPDILIGTAVSGRNNPGTEHIVGLFVNTVVLRDQVDTDETAKAFIERVKTTSLEALRYQDFPFDQLIDELEIPVSLNRNPLFDVMITMDDQHLESDNGFYNTSDPLIKELELSYNVSKFDWIFSFDTRGEDWMVNFVYNTDCYSTRKIALISSYLNHILKQLTHFPERAIGAYSLMEGDEPALFDFLGLSADKHVAAYPLTAVQRDMYLTCVLRPTEVNLRNLGYNSIPMAIDPVIWEKAIQVVTGHDDVLRTTLLKKDEQVYQVVNKQVPVEFSYIDKRSENLTAGDYEQLILDLGVIDQDVNRPPVVHWLIRISDELFITCVSAHHILFDGTAFKCYYEELDKVYFALLAGEEPVASAKPSFRDYVFQSQQLFDTPKREAFWREELKNVELLHYAGALSTTDNLVADRISLEGNEAQEIKAYCKERQIRPDIFFRAIYALLVDYYTSPESDFCLRENGFGRSRSYFNSIGCFMHTTPVLIRRNSIRPDTDFAELCRSLTAQREAIKGQEELSMSLQSRIMGEEPLSFFFNYQKFFEPRTQLGMSLFYQPFFVLETQVELRITETKSGFSLKMDYNERIFNGRRFIDRITLASKQLLNGVTQLCDLDFLLPEEREEQLKGFNPEMQTLPENQTVLSLFHEQVQQQPDQIALVYGDQHLSYTELDRLSDQIAVGIQAGVVDPSQAVVGLLIDRSEWMVIATLGVMKSGAAYLPIDPDYPEERIQYLLSDSDCSLLLTHTGQAYDLKFGGATLDLDQLTKQDPVFVPVKVSQEQRAYIIYTSGTTGLPKGVVVNHRSLLNSALAWRSAYGLNKMDVNLLQLAGFSFDVFTGDLVRALTNGGKIVVCGKDARLDFPSLYNLLLGHRISLFESTPALVLPFMQWIYENEQPIDFLQLLIVGSDSISAADFRLLNKRFGHQLRIINSYGVTEACIDSSFYELSAESLPAKGNTPIGKPLANTRFTIVDPNGRMLPVGVPGELLIGGRGVAEGYYNRPELTAERFIESPFFSDERVYRTGDRARWLPDGNVAFMDRTDNQVKVRGYRIEPAEVEHTLLQLDGINAAVVIATGPADDKELVAYVVADHEISVPDIRLQLTRSLPEYMIPGRIVQLETIPLTPNGKTDRNALPDPFASEVNKHFKAPETPAETIIAGIWQDVLKRDSIGVLDNFFDLGGHSLKATAVIARVQHALHVDIPLAFLFRNPTIEALARYIDGGEIKAETTIPKAEEKAFYELSSAQLRLYLLQQIEGAGNSYNMPGVVRISGQLDRQRLEMSLKKLIERHEALRTSFEMRRGLPAQIIHPEVPFELVCSKVSEEELENRIQSHIQPFDLEAAPLFRAVLLELSETEHVLLFDMHHIISDGVSMTVFIRDLVKIFEGEQLEPLSVQYTDFVEWNQTQVTAHSRHEMWWLNQFTDEVPLLGLPTDFARPAVKTFSGDRVKLETDPQLTQALRAFSKEHRVTMNQLLLTVYTTVLHRYSGSEDIVIGTPVAGRVHPQLEDIMGVFVNSLALRHYPESDKSFLTLLAEVRETSLAALEHQEYPFEQLIDRLNVARDQSRNPLFDVFFSYVQETPQTLQLGDATFSLLKDTNQTAKFDLSAEVREQENELVISLEYSTDLFRRETILQFGRHFLQLLGAVVQNPESSLVNLELLGPEEKKERWKGDDQTSINWPKDRTIHNYFEEQVQLRPDAIAVQHGEQTWTYRELDEWSNKIAHAILEKGISGNEIIALLFDRGPEKIAAILGTLKAGCAYLPIDPDYPEERKTYVLEDSGAKLIVTQSDLYSGSLSAVTIDEDLNTFSATKPIIEVFPTDLCYIIYTSGSTGQPKGVMLEHRNVVRLFFNDAPLFDFSEDDTWSLFHSYCFDFSVWEMYGALLFGGKLVIVGKETAQSPSDFLELLSRHQVTILNQTPGSFYGLIDSALTHPDLPLSLRKVIFGGEALKPARLKEWHAVHPEVALINMYGITETTVHVTYKEITARDIETNSSSIGTAIPTLSMLVLDSVLQPVPTGVAGELCVGGAGVARAYLNRPDLTAERFIVHPQTGERLYRSGDLVRRLADGDHEYLGRIDHQVKIRGYRIELGEIEQALGRHHLLTDILVIDREDTSGSNYLCAYFTAEREVPSSELRSFAAEFLPDYMVPAWFVQLDAFPLTSNGKVNRKAMPLPKTLQLVDKVQVPASTATEERLLEIWKDLLGLENIGVTGDFFEAGGHSLSAAQMVARIHRDFGAEISLKAVFAQPDIRSLSLLIDKAIKSEYDAIPRLEEKEFYALSPAENRLYILQQLDPNSTVYNIPGVLSISGDFDAARLETAFCKMIARHDVLRSRYVVQDGELVKFIDELFSFTLNDLGTTASVSATLQDFIRSFNLNEGPLIRAAFVRYSNQVLLLFDIHHIVADGVSMDVIIRELSAGYAGHELEPLKLQYQDVAQWQVDFAATESYRTQEAYWTAQFKDIPVLDFPTDFTRPAVRSFMGERYENSIDLRQADKIRALAFESGTTPFMVLLAVYNILLSKYSSQEDVIVGTPVAGRSRAEMMPLIGMFVNTLALRNRVIPQSSFRDFLTTVGNSTVNAFDHSDYPLESLIGQLNVTRDPSRNPLFDMLFTYQPLNRQTVDLEDLVLAPWPMGHTTAKMDLTLDVRELEDGSLATGIEYATALFAPRTIDRLHGHFRQLIEAVTANPDRSIAEMELITPLEKHRILSGFNNTQTLFPTVSSITVQLEDLAVLHGDSPAILSTSRSLSYSDLIAETTRVATLLQEAGVEHEQRVGIFADRSVDALIAQLGVLKAGATWVYLDPNLPVERLTHIVSDSAVSVILSNQDQTAFSVPIIDIQAVTSGVYTSTPPASLAYIIYTSGTTGKPKGVAVERESVLNLAHWFGRHYELAAGTRVAQLTQLTFDVSIEETLVPLLHGACVCMLSKEELLDKKAFSRLMNEYRVEIAQFVPATLRSLLVENERLPALKTVICGGDQLDHPLKDAVLSMGYTLYNHYGPTETTVDTLTWKCEPTAMPHPFEGKNAWQLIETMTQNHPDQKAITYRDQSITYRELLERTEQLAAHLQHQGAGKDKVVGILLDRSIEMVVALLGVMRSGAAFLPLDADQPAERLSYILRDSKAEVLLTQSKFIQHIDFQNITIDISKITSTNLFTEDPLDPEQLAYVIYTSGSTGKPKGVEVEHRSLGNFLRGMSEDYNGRFGPGDVCSALANNSFDASIFEVFIPLIHGATLLMLDREQMFDLKGLAATMYANKVTFSYIPASLLPSLHLQLRACESVYLNKLLVGVEPIKDQVLQDYIALNPEMQIVNVYGPTETTIYCTSYSYTSRKPSGTNVPIGKPIANTRIYIVDEYDRLQPIGVPGELCIAGAGLGRGYLNRPDLTADKFAPNPFEPGERMYRSGDIARWREDGNIEFLGRRDYQVKIRGFRIEPGEIEAQLMQVNGIRQALVLDRTDHSGNKYLCAYLVGDTRSDVSTLRTTLAKELPDYMIPSCFVFLDAFPLTSNEKIDRRALPEPDLQQMNILNEYEAPGNETEKQLANLWAEVLEQSKIGVTANFFELGGNSMKIIALFSKLQEQFGEAIQVSDLFDKPTVRQQAAHINSTKEPAISEVDETPKRSRRVEF